MNMRTTIGTIRHIIRESLKTQQAWVPRRWMPQDGEPVKPDEVEKMSEENETDEVTTCESDS